MEVSRGGVGTFCPAAGCSGVLPAPPAACSRVLPAPQLCTASAGLQVSLQEALPQGSREGRGVCPRVAYCV